MLLREARSHYAWSDRPVSEALLHEIYDIAKMGATSMNSCPMRVFFVRSPEAREQLLAALKPTNVSKMVGAPVTAIIAHDVEFWRELPKLFPHEDRRHLFEGKPEYCAETAFRNATLQGAYLMIAARAVGLDVGAMSGFSNEAVRAESPVYPDAFGTFRCFKAVGRTTPVRSMPSSRPFIVA